MKARGLAHLLLKPTSPHQYRVKRPLSLSPGTSLLSLVGVIPVPVPHSHRTPLEKNSKKYSGILRDLNVSREGGTSWHVKTKMATGQCLKQTLIS